MSGEAPQQDGAAKSASSKELAKMASETKAATTAPPPVVEEPAAKKAKEGAEAAAPAADAKTAESKGAAAEVPKFSARESLHKMPGMTETPEENASSEQVEFGKIPMEQAMSIFGSSEEGLTEDQVTKLREKWGRNAVETVPPNKCLMFLMFMWNPLSWVMEMAAIVAIVLSNGPTPWLCDPASENFQKCIVTNQAPDWEDFVGIVFLLIINAVIGFIEENAAGNAVAELMSKLTPKANVKRAGKWINVDASDLVPGDVVTIKLGDIIPADLKLFDGEPLRVDQSGLTGESLPVKKNPGDEVYSGTIVKQGEIHALVFATGGNTYFGKSLVLIDSVEARGHLQQVLKQIGLFCMAWISIWILIIVAVCYGRWEWDYRRGINMVLVVLIGGIPIAMPTVLSVTMALGVNALAKEDAVVTRITAVEELAGMDILCSDKTGTLTKNKLSVYEPKVCQNFSGSQIMLYSGLSARREGAPDAIDLCIVESVFKSLGANAFDDYVVTKFIPFNPTDKKTIAYCEKKSDGTKFVCSKGAPQVMLNDAYNAEEIRAEQEKAINDFAEAGYRTIGVAVSFDDTKTWQFVGLMPLYDPPRDDTQRTIEQAIELGVRVKMITGDQVAIGKEVARQLGMGLNFHNAKVVRSEFVEGVPIKQIIEEADGFGEVFPEDKYAVVSMLRTIQNGPNGGPHLVGMTGDGVNDAPALKVADVGIAVKGATDAAQSAAAIVLLSEGLSVIITAIKGSRCIFQRMKNYAIYACATTIRIVTTFGLLATIWEFSFPPFMVLVIAYLNDGTIMTISKDYAVHSMTPDYWALREIFTQAFVIGLWLTASTVVFYYIIQYTKFFENTVGVTPVIKYNREYPIDNASKQMASVIYLQVSITGQMVIFSTRARNYFCTSIPSPWLCMAFVVAQLVATFIAVYADWSFTGIYGCGWHWAGVAWIWSFVWYAPLDAVKILARLVLTGDLWDGTLLKKKAMFHMGFNPKASHMGKNSSKKAPNSRAYAVASTKKR